MEQISQYKFSFLFFVQERRKFLKSPVWFDRMLTEIYMSFLDSNANVQKISYSYKILSSNQCGLVSPDGNFGCSIVLTGSSIPFENDLACTHIKPGRMRF